MIIYGLLPREIQQRLLAGGEWPAVQDVQDSLKAHRDQLWREWTPRSNPARPRANT